MRALALMGVLLGGLVLAPGVARAEKVKLDIKVVEASQQGATVDPKLAHMRDDFKKKGFAYSSYKLVSEKAVTVDLKATTEVPLPGGKVAKLTPTEAEKAGKGKITVHAEIPGLLDLNYTVGNRGTNFVGGGANGNDQVFLVIKHEVQ